MILFACLCFVTIVTVDYCSIAGVDLEFSERGLITVMDIIMKKLYIGYVVLWSTEMPPNARFNLNAKVLWEGANQSSIRGVVGATLWKV